MHIFGFGCCFGSGFELQDCGLVWLLICGFCALFVCLCLNCFLTSGYEFTLIGWVLGCELGGFRCFGVICEG